MRIIFASLGRETGKYIRFYGARFSMLLKVTSMLLPIYTNMVDLKTPVGALNKVGKSAAKKLEKLGVSTVKDLLYFFPYRYDDFRKIVLVKDLVEGEQVTVKVRVELVQSRRSFKRRMNISEVLVSDDTGSARLMWFNQPYIVKQLETGDELFVSGKVSSDMLGNKFMSPSWEKVKPDNSPTHTARMVPIYPLTKGLSEKQVRFLIGGVIGLADTIPDWLPDFVLEKYDLVPSSHALRGVHYPVDEVNLATALKRLKFDELLLVQLKSELAKRDRSLLHAERIPFREQEIKEAVAGLPFTLTKSQKVAAWEIMKDIGRDEPMNRLLSGDVGSGKTVVAGLSLFLTTLNRFQSAFMAPTEILARQHYLTLQKLFGDRFRVGLLTNVYAEMPGIEVEGSHTKKRKALLESLKKGSIDVLVGTHALLTEDVKFKKLGLVVVDEQHRFGVDQRKVMKQKGKGAHFLSMTATPIPRSLALVVYGDLALSIIDELPPNRKKIVTRLVPATKRTVAYEFIEGQVKKGRQVFVVCPLIEEAVGLSAVSAGTEKKSVMSEYEKLSKKIFPNLVVAYLHGKMKGEEKEKIMADFKAGVTNILVSTSVIEVGVDIPNASVMMIEGADRFGLAQLHQFRGRVGRGSEQSYCLLFTDANSPKTLERLEYFAAHDNGFELAEKDLELRGPGEVYGTEQSGMNELKFAKLTDQVIIKEARDVAPELIEAVKDYPLVAEKIKEWEKQIHLE